MNHIKLEKKKKKEYNKLTYQTDLKELLKKSKKDNKIKIKTNGVFTRMYIDGIELKNIQYLKFEHKNPEELPSINIRFSPLYCEIESLDFNKI